MSFSDVHVSREQCCANCVECSHECLDGIRQVGFISFVMFCLGPWFLLARVVCRVKMYGNTVSVTRKLTTQTAEIVPKFLPRAPNNRTSRFSFSRLSVFDVFGFSYNTE